MRTCKRIFADAYIIISIVALILIAVIIGFTFNQASMTASVQQARIEIKNSVQAVSTEYKDVDSNIMQPHVEFKAKRKKLMFYKTHKCGTSSLVSVLYLYGIRRNLNFVMTPFQHQILYDEPIQKLKEGEEYHILCQHQRDDVKRWGPYRPSFVHSILAKQETFYFTIIRKPFDQFLSNFQFFEHGKIVQEKFAVKLSLDEKISIYINSQPNSTIICNRVVNPMSYDLGFTRFLRPEISLDKALDRFIAFLEQEFDYIMIMDRFDESMMVLKTYLGWEDSDMTYLKRMTRRKSETKNKSPVSPYTSKLISEHNFVDEKIYKHFSKVLDKRISSIGVDVITESVSKYRTLNHELTSTCLNTTHTRNSSLGTVFFPLKRTAQSMPQCRLLTMSDIFISKALSLKQLREDEKPPPNTKWLGFLPRFVNMFKKIREDYVKNND